MQQREGFPAGVPAWVDRTVEDPASLADFYAGLFGWTFDDADRVGDTYLVARLDGRRAAGMGKVRPGIPDPRAWNMYVACDDVETAAERVRSAGGTVVADPAALVDIARVASCLDPAGAAFGLWEPRPVGGAEVVNTPGAWNFSELNAADPEGARRFYGEIFGWEVDDVDFAGAPSLMVRLPGYADFLEQFDPGIRQRHADFGAPPGFSECIAWILPLDGDATPHWSVTFTVADADAVAARARELGGTVEMEPVEIGPVRSVKLRDPGGAAFAASAFNPG